MSDCEVLDADAAAKNHNFRHGPSNSIPPLHGSVQPPEMGAPHEAVLLDEDPKEPMGRQYSGTVVWRVQSVKAGVGQAGDVAVRAEIDIPERKFKMTMSFRRNTDPTLPASHTVELSFSLPPDLAGGGISSVPGILLKSSEQSRSSPLKTTSVRISDKFFMIGLPSAPDDRDHNIQLLNERSWFDIPIVYVDGRKAIVSFKKGIYGQQAFDQALSSWKSETGTQQSAVVPATKDNSDSGVVLQIYTAQMERVDRLFWLSFNASICQLRSTRWFEVMKSSWDTWNDAAIKSSGMTYDHANTILQSVKGRITAEYGDFPSICQRLRNSAVMDELDRAEALATGNYH
jgi:hypothetical protein